jgi:hypothetical protein
MLDCGQHPIQSFFNGKGPQGPSAFHFSAVPYILQERIGE